MPRERVTIEGVMITRDGPGDPHPEHPIHYPDPPGNPPGIWGPPDPRPTPPIFIPPDYISDGVPTHPIWIPVRPAHPIVIPPGSLGGGHPEHPIFLPPVISGPPGPWPSPPIFLPPDSVGPGVPSHPIVLPQPPLTIWGPTDPFPTPPIFIPDPVPGVSVVYVPNLNAWMWVRTMDLHPLSDPMVPSPEPK